MAYQAALNGGGIRPGYSGPDTLMGNLAEFGSDVATLAELQTKLVVVDLKDVVGRATYPIIFVVAGAIVAVAALPILLIGVAEALVQIGLFTRAWSYVLTALVTIAAAGLVAFLAWKAFTRSFASLSRSQEELTRNINWLKTVVTSGGNFQQKSRR